MDSRHNQHASLKRNLAEATEFARNKEYGQAIQRLKNILNEDPDHEIAQGMLAAVYMQIGMHERANELYQHILQNNSDNVLARFQLGISVFNQGNNEEALHIWEPLLEQDNEFMAHYYSGLALMQLNKDKQAMVMFEHVRRYMPDAHPLYSQLLTQLQR